MKHRPEKTSKKGLRMCINKSDFDAILNGTKNKLYRAITDNTIKEYIKHENVDGVEHFSYYDDMISDENLYLYGIDLCFYYDGKFPFVPKHIKYLVLIEPRCSFMDKLTIEVTDISFEPSKNEDGSIMRISYSIEKGNLVSDENGELAMWYIVYHLGDIVSNDLKLDFGWDGSFGDNCPF